MLSSICNIDDFDSKVRVTIGEILSKADPLSKSVLTAYDSSKDRHANVKVLGGPKFQAMALDMCAEFLQIQVKHESGTRIYTNKPTLAMRIILEIESFFWQSVVNVVRSTRLNLMNPNLRNCDVFFAFRETITVINLIKRSKLCQLISPLAWFGFALAASL